VEEGTRRVQLADARVLHEARRAVRRGNGLATSVASKYDHEQSAF
jgi:hypothetical protein